MRKGDEDHNAVAEALRAEDCHLDNWQQGRALPGETRNASNWVGNTDREWKTYIGHYNRHMRMHPADRQKHLNDSKTLRIRIARLNRQWQSGQVQFKHQLHTGELELDEEFYECWKKAEAEREQFYTDWEEAETEQEIERREQEYQDHCRHHPPNSKDCDRRMYLPEKRSDR